jgi:hypothetical protein
LDIITHIRKGSIRIVNGHCWIELIIDITIHGGLKYKGDNMDTIINRKELLVFWKTKGSPFMWEDIKNISKRENVKTLEDLDKILNILRNKKLKNS